MAGPKIPLIPVWHLACLAYDLILRDLLIKSVEDPNAQWDDMVLSICDRIFGYTPK